MAAPEYMYVPNILGRYSIQHIMDELCIPRILRKEVVFPPKYMYITKLIPVVLDLYNVHYTCWSTLFRQAARAHNLLHHIDPNVPTPPLPDIINITSIPDDEITLWCQQDAVLLTWIFATVSPYLLFRLLNQKSYTTTAMDCWARLRDICRECNTTTMHEKKRRFICIDQDYDQGGVEEDENDDGLDLLSNLPDELLVNILSLAAHVKTAVRTSILSKRWTHVWTHLMDLDFNDPEKSRTLKYSCSVRPEIDKFVDGVYRVLIANQAPYLNTFRVYFALNSSYNAHIDNWLKFAFDKEVRNLELNFIASSSPSPRIHLFKIFPTNNPALILNTTLESLYLKSVVIKGPLLQWVITNCLNLQRLSLHSCKASADNYAYFEHSRELVISSLKLKHLELIYCLKLLNIDALVLSAPNLTSFIYYETEIDVEYHSVPSLVDANFGGSCHHHMDTLSRLSSQLEKLSIQWYEAYYHSTGFPTFINVQQLEIVYSQQGFDFLSMMTSLIEACPLMHTFKLKLMYWWNLQLKRPMKKSAPNNAHIKAIRSHQHLKAVEYFGYAGCPSAAQLALCLTRHAPMLRRFIFYTHQPRCIENPHEVQSYNRDQMEIVRRATELLAKQIRGSQGPPTVVIL